MTRNSWKGLITHRTIELAATFFAAIVFLTLPACMSGDENSEAPDSATDGSPGGGDNNTIQQALGIGCNSSSQCTIAAVNATDAPIAACMVADGTCQELEDPASGDSFMGCVGLVDLACVGDLASDGTENCNNGTDDDADGDADCADLDCMGIGCNDGNACTAGDFCFDGECVGALTTPDPGPPASECFERSCDPEVGWGAEPLPAETSCGEFDEECNVGSYCNGTGTCVADTSTSTCCTLATDCPVDMCNGWGDGVYRSCSEPILESDFGQCSCVYFGVEICYDGIDNDEDGLLDCADPECADNASFCTATTSCCELNTTGAGCSDSVGMLEVCIELGDSYCCATSWDAICVREYDAQHGGACDLPETEVTCNDEVDNDFDGWGDCWDEDCLGTPSCPMPDEVCDDGFDNDGDELADCADSADCAENPICAAPDTDTYWCWSSVTACDPRVEPPVWPTELPTTFTELTLGMVGAPACTGGAPGSPSTYPMTGSCCFVADSNTTWPGGGRTCDGPVLDWPSVE